MLLILTILIWYFYFLYFFVVFSFWNTIISLFHSCSSLYILTPSCFLLLQVDSYCFPLLFLCICVGDGCLCCSTCSFHFVVCVWMLSRLTTLHWIANRKTHPWKRQTLLFLEVIFICRFLSRGGTLCNVPNPTLPYPLPLALFQSC